MAYSLSSAAAAALTKRCISSNLARSCARLQSSSFPSRARFTSSLPLASISRDNSSSSCDIQRNIRSFSSMPPPPTASPPNPNLAFQPPSSLTPAAGLGAQDAMKLFIEHGLGKRKLEQIAATKNNSPLVDRWQKMVATYLETQCHVIALLGYRPDEHGIAMYTQHLSQALQLSPPDIQEQLRVAGRDTYRMVLAAAFDIPTLMEDQIQKGELSVVDARNIMHKVSLRMQDPEVLETVAKRCNGPSAMVALNDSVEAKQIELARKHTVVQEIMVKDVYLTEGDGGGGVSLVQECGFGEGEEGYVRMQCAMAEHQGDPLITQYVGAAMMKLLQSAGIDMEALQRGQAS